MSLCLKSIGLILILLLENELWAQHAPKHQLIISMQHEFAGQRLLLDSLRYKTAKSETFSVTRWSYLLSGFALQANDGSWQEMPEAVAWIDLETKRTRFALRGIAPYNYLALRFSVGVEPERNHADPATFSAGHPLNPNVSHLHWTWQSGYIFSALEGHYRSGREVLGYVYHLANDTHYQSVTLPLPFSADENV